MSPTSFEDTIRHVQTTAQNLKLPDALRAINELLVRSWGHEIAVEVPIKEAIYVTFAGHALEVRLMPSVFTGLNIVRTMNILSARNLRLLCATRELRETLKVATMFDTSAGCLWCP